MCGRGLMARALCAALQGDGGLHHGGVGAELPKLSPVGAVHQALICPEMPGDARRRTLNATPPAALQPYLT